MLKSILTLKPEPTGFNHCFRITSFRGIVYC